MGNDAAWDLLLADVYTLLEELCAFEEIADDLRSLLLQLIALARQDDSDVSFTVLPLLLATALSGDHRQALPVAAAWRILHIAAKLIDDVQDNDLPADRRSRLHIGQTLNLATSFSTLASLAFEQLPPDLAGPIRTDFNRTVLQITSGQQADLQWDHSTDLDRVFQIIEAKTGTCFALATRTAARSCTDDLTLIAPSDRFGYNVGMLIQLNDELEGIRQAPGKSDITSGSCSLPITYALTVASPAERARLAKTLAQAPTSVEAERAARAMLTSLGAEAYLMVEIQRFRRQALAVLDLLSERGVRVAALRTWLALLIRSDLPAE